MGNDHVCESWRFVLENNTAREICHCGNSWYVVHDPNDGKMNYSIIRTSSIWKEISFVESRNVPSYYQ